MSVSIIGVGLHPFGRFPISGRQMGVIAAREALADAGLTWNDVNFAAGGIATPADAALMMQMGCDGVFVGSGIFKSGDPAKRAAAITQAKTALARFEAKQSQFKENPSVMIQQDWSSALKSFLGRDSVQMVYVPENLAAIRLLLNADPDLAKAILRGNAERFLGL